MGKPRYSTESFIEKAMLVHGDKYDYSLVVFLSGLKNVDIICKKHGVFKQCPTEHLRGKGCRICGYDNRDCTKGCNTDWFIKESIKVHGLKYDYSQSVYTGAYTEIKIKCNKHGYFYQHPNGHLRGAGCPLCRNSKGETHISNILLKLKIDFKREKKFDGCKISNYMKFDFYLPSYSTLIEYQGIQHFIPINMFGGLNAFMERQRNDEYKKQWAIENGYTFIEYNYKQKWDFIERDLLKRLR